VAVASQVNIEIWSDVACPWCHIGLNRFHAALSSFEHREDVTVRLRSFQLDPSLPESFDGNEIDYLVASKGLRREQVEAMVTQVAGVGAGDSLPFNFPALVVANSRRAHRLIQAAIAADETGELSWKLEQALFTAHFANGISIGDPEALIALAEKVGLPRPVAEEALNSAELDAAVADDIDQARTLGVQAVPTFVFNRTHAISGAQPTEAFSQALEQLWEQASA
jgi:predicted DsbA family dithiol-disulfide isomerase